MDLLKRIPIKYIGELHDIRLINFSVDINEIRDKVPTNIKVRDFNGRALISMVDVKLKNMHPAFVPSFCNFSYRHVAFRLLIEDKQYNEGINKGIFFYQSFTDKALIVEGGKLLTEYKLELATINENDNHVIVNQGDNVVKYSIEDEIIVTPDENSKNLQKTIGALDRAYSFLGDSLRVTQIQREKWPIQPVQCHDFSTNFFSTARFEAAFRVFETIYYKWLPSKTV